MYFFFFQAEDGIRDYDVTGVQTCALPIFLLTQRELGWFYQNGASMLFPDAWERFLAPIPEDERGDLMGAYHRRLVHADRRVQSEAATAWSQWEGDTISIRGPEARPSKFNEVDFAIAFARIECHFFVNKGFFPEDDWILKNVRAEERRAGKECRSRWSRQH